MFTVIGTGSRHLYDIHKVWREFDGLLKVHGSIFVRRGDCPTGVDPFIGLWCLYRGGFQICESIHDANWDDFGKAAGPIRNREMAQAGADLCLAFPLGESRGTWNCVNECKKAGIPVKVIK